MDKIKTPISVLIVSNASNVPELLKERMPQEYYNPVSVVKNCGEARRTLLSQSFDLIIINSPLPDGTGYDFATDITVDSSVCVLLIVKSEFVDEISFKMLDYGVLTIGKPNSRQMFDSSIKLLTAMHKKLILNEQKALKLKEKVDEVKIVNRAKWVLIKYLNIDEDKAHRYIEKQAMNMRITKKEVAEGIIRTYS